MIARQRSAGLMFLGILACLTAGIFSFAARLSADSHSAPTRTAQLVAPSQEPPLAGSPAVPSPPPITVPIPIPNPPFPGETECPVESDVPVVGIQVRVPATVGAGKELEYHFCIENRAQSAPAHHVIVRDPLPPNARFVRATPEPTAREPELVWQLGTLEAGKCREIVLVVAPTGDGDVKNCARVQFEHGQCVTTRIARPTIRLTKCGPTQAYLYESLTYQLTITNTGAITVTDVKVIDNLPQGLEHSELRNQLTWDVGTLNPGASRTREYHVIAKSAGKLCNKALATAAGAAPQEAESCVNVVEAKLNLVKTGPGLRYLNQAAAYDITVSNTGTVPIGNVSVIDVIPPGLTFVSATQGGRLLNAPGAPAGPNGLPANGMARWLIGTLAPGAQRTVNIVLRARAEGTYCNRATATADRGLSVQAEMCTRFNGVSALNLEVDDTEDPVEVGAQTTYRIRIRNQGSIPATEVRFEAEVPAQMEFVRASGPSDLKREGQDGRKLSSAPIRIDPGKFVEYQVQVRALRGGDVRFKVDLYSAQFSSGKPVHEEESTTIYSDNPATRQPPSGPPPLATPPR